MIKIGDEPGVVPVDLGAHCINAQHFEIGDKLRHQSTADTLTRKARIHAKGVDLGLLIRAAKGAEIYPRHDEPHREAVHLGHQ